MPKAQKHCKLHDFYAWTVPKNYEKLAKNRPKNANKDLQNASSNFTLFFPTPNPQKRENPSRLKDFRGGSAAGARPRVAKAMLSCHHYTARHRRIYEAYAWQPGAGQSRPVEGMRWVQSMSMFWCCRCCCCWPMLALFGRRFTPVLARSCCCCWCCCCGCCCGCGCCCCSCCCCYCRCRPGWLCCCCGCCCCGCCCIWRSCGCCCCWPMLALFGRSFAPVLALGCPI